MSTSREGIENTWIARSIPPAARRMFSVVLGGESQVQHVAPRDVGNGRVYRPGEDGEVDVAASERRSTLTCERYDDTKICLNQHQLTITIQIMETQTLPS